MQAGVGADIGPRYERTDLFLVKREYALSSFSATISWVGFPSLRTIYGIPYVSKLRIVGISGRGAIPPARARGVASGTYTNVVELHGGLGCAV